MSTESAKYTFRAATADEQDAQLPRTEPFGHFRPNLAQRAIIGLAYGTILSRGNARRWLSNLVARLGHPVDVERENCKYRLYLENNLIAHGLLLRSTYNGPEIAFLKAHLGAGKVAVDIGANMGLYAIQLAATGAKVIAIDANPLMARQLQFNADANGFDNLQVFNCAVSDTVGTGNLRVRNDDLAIAEVVQNDAGAIAMRPLQDILSEVGIDRVDVLKIDVEGHEDRALAPFIANCDAALLPTRIVIEEWGAEDHPACQKAFAARGYKLRARHRNNALYERAAD